MPVQDGLGGEAATYSGAYHLFNAFEILFQSIVRSTGWGEHWFIERSLTHVPRTKALYLHLGNERSLFVNSKGSSGLSNQRGLDLHTMSTSISGHS